MSKHTLLAVVSALSLAACVAPSGSADRAPPAPAAPPPASAAVPLPTGPNPTVGGATMYADRPIARNVADAPNLSTLVTALKSAGLDDKLSGPGLYTVFAPTNDAFARLAPGRLDLLLSSENKDALSKVLNYHVVPGALSAAELTRRVQAGGGTATLTTAAGQTLTATLESGVVALTDANGVKSYVETADVRQSNGVVHVINGVLVPRLG